MNTILTTSPPREKRGEHDNLNPVLGFKRYTGSRCDISQGSVIELKARETVNTKRGSQILAGRTYFAIADLQLSKAGTWVWTGYPIAYETEYGLTKAPMAGLFEPRHLCGIHMDKNSRVAIVQATAEHFLAVAFPEMEVSHAA